MSLNLPLIATDVTTTVPLLCFTSVTTRLHLSMLGFFQYIGPALMFLLAVTFYDEISGTDKMVTLAFIWVTLAILVMDAIYAQRQVYWSQESAGRCFAYPAYKSTSPQAG